MKLVFFFLAASALFTIAAIPMQLSQGSSSTPNPHYIPKIHLQYRPMTKNDRAAARNMIIDHYKGLGPGDDYKGAKLAHTNNGWRDGKSPDDEHKQYFDFNYYRGDGPKSDKIGKTVTLSRDRPPPESHFTLSVPPENKAEIAKEMDKRYKALPSEQAKRVRSMKAHGDWGDGTGLREETRMTFHHGTLPSIYNELWDPVTIHRPMSFLIDDKVPTKEAPVIKKRIRQEYENLDENHPLKQANFGVVTEGWHKLPKSGGFQAGATMYKVKDQLTDSAEEDFEKIDYFRVPLGQGRNPEDDSSSTGSKRKRS